SARMPVCVQPMQSPTCPSARSISASTAGVRVFFFFYSSVAPCDLHSFPTRRSSDLSSLPTISPSAWRSTMKPVTPSSVLAYSAIDRKSTRLNSSHVKISYAVFCLKKKKVREDTEDGRSSRVRIIGFLVLLLAAGRQH